MIEYQESVEIQRPVSAVFAYLIVAENFPEWVPTTVEAWQVSDGPVAEGTRLTETVTLGFFKSRALNQLDWEITEFEENQRVTFENYSGLGYQSQSFSLVPTERGTRLLVNGTHRFKGPTRIAQPVLRFFIERARKKHLMNLKQILETGRPAS